MVPFILPCVYNYDYDNSNNIREGLRSYKCQDPKIGGSFVHQEKHGEFLLIFAGIPSDRFNVFPFELLLGIDRYYRE